MAKGCSSPVHALTLWVPRAYLSSNIHGNHVCRRQANTRKKFMVLVGGAKHMTTTMPNPMSNYTCGAVQTLFIAPNGHDKKN